jgi:GntR family transcriptional regulator
VAVARKAKAPDDGPSARERTAPKYPEILSQLRADIASDSYKHGDKFATEAALMERFHVSRPPVHRALVELESEGLVELRRGVGTFVRKWEPIVRNVTNRLKPEAHQGGRSMWDEETADRDYKAESGPARREVAPSRVAEALGVSDVEVRRRRHFVDGRAVMLSVSYYPAEIVEGSQITEASTGPGGSPERLAELGHGPSRHREKFRSRLPNAEERKGLALPPGSTVAEFVRTSWDPVGRPVEVTEMVAAGDAFEFQIDAPF